MKKLLFVEDDIITGSIYRYHFTTAGYQVKLADDGEKALAALEQFAPDVVVLDLLLPKVNGIAVLKRIRSQPETKGIPVIVFTSDYLGEMAREAEKLGISRCLPKAKTGASGLLAAIVSALANAPAPGDTPNLTATARVLDPSEAAKPQPVIPEPVIARPEFIHPRDEFLRHTPHALAAMRRLTHELLGESRAEARPPLVLALQIKVHSLTSTAALAHAFSFAQMTSALGVLLKELYEKPKNLNASTLRTVHQAVEFLGPLFDHAFFDQSEKATPFNILVVDDEVIARKAVTMALGRAQLKAVSLEDPHAAFDLAQREAFDLVITDVNMPGMTGFELCEKLHATPRNAKTPVVFVTALNDFSARMQSATSGGNDFIAKPFVAMELAVKALLHLRRGRLPQSPPAFQSFRPE